MTQTILTQSQLADIVSALIDRNIIDDFTDVRHDYSGRGMYGKSCIGLVTGRNGIEIGIALAEVIEELNTLNFETPDWDDLDITEFCNAAQDSMGYSVIWYWPGLGVEPIES